MKFDFMFISNRFMLKTVDTIVKLNKQVKFFEIC